MDILREVTDPFLHGMIELCKAEVPRFEIKFKDESKLMKGLNFFARIFNKKFMSEYTTTLGSTVYFPSKRKLLDSQEMYAEILAHELVHMKEREDVGSLLYFLDYAFPQILSVFFVLSVLAVWNTWFLLCLVFLLFLLPIPSPGRRSIELNGYEMSLAVTHWKRGLHEENFEWATLQFTGPSYYFMWPWRKAILHELKLRAVKMRTGEILRDPLFRKVYDLVKTG